MPTQVPCWARFHLPQCMQIVQLVALVHLQDTRHHVSADGEISASGESAAGAAATEAAEEYFDLEDLGRLRRNVRRAIENVQRERELYHEIILQYLEVCFVLPETLVPCNSRCSKHGAPQLGNILMLRQGIGVQVSDVLANRLHRGQPFHSSTRQRPLPAWLQHAEWWWRCVLRGWVYRCVPGFWLVPVLNMRHVIILFLCTDLRPLMVCKASDE